MARKKYRVDVTDAANRDLASIKARIARDARMAATKWVRTARKHVLSLAFMPLRFEVIPETADDDFEQQYRHLIFGNYRILYWVEETRVVIARVIYATRILTAQMLSGVES